MLHSLQQQQLQQLLHSSLARPDNKSISTHIHKVLAFIGGLPLPTPRCYNCWKLDELPQLRLCLWALPACWLME